MVDKPAVWKRPEQVEIGEVFEQPASEEEMHGLVERPAHPPRYRVIDKQQKGLMTHFLTDRLSDNRRMEVIMVPWVKVRIIKDV